MLQHMLKVNVVEALNSLLPEVKWKTMLSLNQQDSIDVTWNLCSLNAADLLCSSVLAFYISEPRSAVV